VAGHAPPGEPTPPKEEPKVPLWQPEPEPAATQAEPPAAEPASPIWEPEPEPAAEAPRERSVPELLASDPPLKEDEPASRGEIAYTYDAAPSRRQTNRAARRRIRFLVRSAVLLAVIAAIGGGIVAYLEYVQPKILSPSELYARAHEHQQEGNHAAAAADFVSFAERAPEDPRRGDAQFNAALATWMISPESAAEKTAQNERVLTLLQAFLRDNNAHQKTARAQSMLGVVLHDLGRYDEAIGQLRASIDASDDPLAVLPLSRTLASAYRREGSIGEAEATYLQAAALPGNYTADQDFYDLGDMFAQLSETAERESDALAYAAKAAGYLEDATEVAGANPDDRGKIEQRIAMLRRATGLTEELPSANPAAALPSEPAAELVPAETPEPAPAGMDANEPNPAAEAQALGHADIVQTEQP